MRDPQRTCNFLAHGCDLFSAENSCQCIVRGLLRFYSMEQSRQHEEVVEV